MALHSAPMPAIPRGRRIGSLGFVGILYSEGLDGGIISGGNLYDVAGEGFFGIGINDNGVWIEAANGQGCMVGAFGPDGPEGYGAFEAEVLLQQNTRSSTSPALASAHPKQFPDLRPLTFRQRQNEQSPGHLPAMLKMQVLQRLSIDS